LVQRFRSRKKTGPTALKGEYFSIIRFRWNPHSDALAGLFRGLNDDQEAFLERVALAALAAGKRRTAGDVRSQAARNAAPTQALGGPGIGPFEVPAFVPHELGDKRVIARRSAREQGKPSFRSSSEEESSAHVNRQTRESPPNKESTTARKSTTRKENK
jgi:hypothetical protein